MKISMPAPLNLIGLRVGLLVAIKPTKERGFGQVVWLCQCDCGKKKKVKASILKTQQITSCGCMTLTIHSRPNVKNKKHGQSHSKLHRIWSQIKQRCLNENCHAWKWYGARGIKICDQWRYSFEKFYHDMAPTYFEGATIERVDNNKDYEPKNCIWIPLKEQSRNRRCVTTYDTPWGKMSLNEASRKAGYNPGFFRFRLEQGWPLDLLFSPKVLNRKRPTINPSLGA